MINHSKSSTKKNVLHNYNIKKADKIELLKSTELIQKQINNWFIKL